ncbi:MAG: succinate--CoA ligase subunit beta [Deltaproteobacteria bacterium RIFOXYA12_FULL_61_11]|nr:MAG: succinate--CoA ligase subunit beta [Deltaproteobacteria bacterium RIFOXYA12_FULL_61_11]
MKLHEYQSKELFKKYDLPVPKGWLLEDLSGLDEILRKAGNTMLVVKAQVHAGGRGKGGGVKLGRSPEEIRNHAKTILGMTLVTHQTGPQGVTVRKVLLEEGCKIKKEMYLGLTVDRGHGKIAIMASEAGGMDIEEVAAKTPEKIHIELVDPLIGLMPYQARKLAFALNLTGTLAKDWVPFLTKVYKVFADNDCSLVEINPLVITADDTLIALDGKIDLDGNALFRHRDLLEFRDVHEEDPREFEASKHGLSFISLDGNIGCMVNGAGLAMATMDIIKHHGGSPANFLDVGGSATTEAVTEAFKLLLSDSQVKGVMINIFGGIMKCDTIANGIIEASKRVAVKVPLVVRLEGTNVDLGKKILKESGLAITTADTMADAAQKIVTIVKQGRA